MRDYRDAKAMAKVLREELASRQIELQHSQALEITARQLGVENWNILSAAIAAPSPGPTVQSIAFDDVVPIIRIFDVAKAHEFYLGFLGFAAAGFILLSVFLAMVLMTLKPRDACAQAS